MWCRSRRALAQCACARRNETICTHFAFAAPRLFLFWFCVRHSGAGPSGDPAAAAAAAGDEADAVTTAGANAGVAPAAADDPSLWVLEDVEEMDAPVVLAMGEGFRPSAEDQFKLDEIDASVSRRRDRGKGAREFGCVGCVALAVG